VELGACCMPGCIGEGSSEIDRASCACLSVGGGGNGVDFRNKNPFFF
jgi:hypothetical protein